MDSGVRRILLVDDNINIHDDFKQILSSCAGNQENQKSKLELFLFDKSDVGDSALPVQYQIDDAYSGKEAIAMVDQAEQETNPYALIFMDVRMPPGIDGVEAVLQIWKNHPYVEIVICTAYSDYTWEQILSKLPLTDQLLFIKKPFDELTIKQTTLSLIKKWELKRKNRAYIDNLETEIARQMIELQSTNKQLRQEIFERKRAEEERYKIEKQLHQIKKMEAIGQLAGGIAHDFNNMIGAIKGYADLIDQNFTQNNDKLKRFVGAILSAADHSADLTAKLLAFARRGKFEVTPVDIHELIADMLKILERSLDKRIEIQQNLNADPSTVMGDHTQLQNVLLNLAVNARDAMPNGGTMTFHTETEIIDKEFITTQPYHIVPGKYFKLVVTDSGIGMSEETKSRIFEPFFTTKEHGKGTGLGLASVYGTIKSHEGFINVESAPGKGTIFQIYLPSTNNLCEKFVQKTEEIKQGTGCIMVIDDEELFLQMTKEMLEDLGYETYSFSDTDMAIQMYKTNYKKYDLVIIDIVMPKISGYECFLKLKDINPHIKAVVASGYIFHDEINKILEAGALKFLHKPFSIGEISLALEDVVKINNIGV